MTLRGHSSDIWCLEILKTLNYYIEKDYVDNGCKKESNKNNNRNNVFNNTVLFSGGNDGSVKSWILADHAVTCPENLSSTSNAITIPLFPSSSDKNNDINNDINGEKIDKMNVDTEALSLIPPKHRKVSPKRTNGVSVVKISPDGLWGVLLLCKGEVVLIDFNTATHSSSNDNNSSIDNNDIDKLKNGWKHIVTLNKAIINGDVSFYYSNTSNKNTDENSNRNLNINVNSNEIKKNDETDIGVENTRIMTCHISCAHADGFVTDFDYNHDDKIDGEETFIKNFNCWKAHEFRTINIWQLSRFKNDNIQYKENVDSYLLTSSVKGVCRFWGLSSNTNNNNGSGDGNDNTIATSPLAPIPPNDINTHKYILFFQCVTAKDQIATCCLLLSNFSLLIGDTKGGISLFKLMTINSNCADGLDLKQLQIDTIPVTIPCTTFIPSAHNIDLVSCLAECPTENHGFHSDKETNGFCSVGHDGYFCVYDSNGHLISKVSCVNVNKPGK